MSSASSERRLLFATIGSLGDLFPYLTIARTLQRRGFRCTVATGRMHRGVVESFGVSFHEIGPDLTNNDEAPEWTRMATHPRRGSEFIIRRMILPSLPETYRDVEPAVVRADCVVAHPLCYAAKLAAERHGVPLVVAALQPALFFSSYDPPVVARTPTAGPARALGRPFFAVVFGFVRVVLRYWAAPLRRFRRTIGLPRVRSDVLIEGQYSPRLNLALFSPLLAEPDPDWPAETVQTGFVFHDRDTGGGDLDPARELDATLERFLQSGPPPVVFTLGSLAVMNPGRFYTESVSAVRRLGLRAVLLGGDPTGVESGGDLFIAGYVPHSRLFPRASVVVHQGGVGTTAEALRAGRPQLVVPFANDQPDNAYRVRRLGVARVLALRGYRAAHVASELEHLLGRRSYADRAAAVAEEIARERGAERACDAIEASVAQPEKSQV